MVFVQVPRLRKQISRSFEYEKPTHWLRTPQWLLHSFNVAKEVSTRKSPGQLPSSGMKVIRRLCWLPLLKAVLVFLLMGGSAMAAKQVKSRTKADTCISQCRRNMVTNGIKAI